LQGAQREAAELQSSKVQASELQVWVALCAAVVGTLPFERHCLMIVTGMLHFVHLH